MEEYHLAIHIFDHDKEGLRRTVDFFIPSKVRYDREIDSKEGPSDGLDLRLEPETSSSMRYPKSQTSIETY